ncbi:MAG: TetR/AcrR family transcriptional regulator, partial [Cytophagales bacterium]|nr:TetR/AcrR family transcriptional regulator [Cytophagales bacterium]
MQLFWCKGYNATSVQDLVENLGINRASMYDTFTDK